MGSGEWQTVAGRRQRRAPQLLGVELRGDPEQGQGQGEGKGRGQAKAQGKGQWPGRHTGKPHFRNGELGHTAGARSEGFVTGGREAGAECDETGRSGLPLPGWGPGHDRRKASKARATKPEQRAASSAQHSSLVSGLENPDLKKVEFDKLEPRATGRGSEGSGAAESGNSRVPLRGADESCTSTCGGTTGEFPLAGVGAQSTNRDRLGRPSAGLGCAGGGVQGVPEAASTRTQGAREKTHAATSSGGAAGGASASEVSAIVRRIQEAKEQVAESPFFRTFTGQMGDLKITDWFTAPGSFPRDSTSVPRQSSTSITTQSSTTTPRQSSTGKPPAAQEEDRAEGEGEEAEKCPTHVPATMTAPGAERCEVQLVVYGVGSVGDSRVSRCQLALALLLRDHITHSLTHRPAGDASDALVRVFVFDPVLELQEREALASLGLCCLDSNENGFMRFGAEPEASSNGADPASGSVRSKSLAQTGPTPRTLFFMPHCEAFLYSNVVSAHAQHLAGIVILGNSFRMYEDRWSFRPKEEPEAPALLELFAQEAFTEYPVDPCNFHVVSAFNDMRCV